MQAEEKEEAEEEEEEADIQEEERACSQWLPPCLALHDELQR